MNTIDLHMHSIKSGDGQFTSKQLVEQAFNNGIEVMAISDHDAVSGIDEGLFYAEKYGIKLIRAVELCCEFLGTGLHILGYNIDHHDSRFIERENKTRQLFIDSSDDIIDAALNFGFKFDRKLVKEHSNGGIVTEEMIGEAILADSRNDNDDRLAQYREGGNKSDNPGFNFYKDFCCQGKPLYVEVDNLNMDLTYASKLIHETGGIMVLAHPAHNIGHDLNKLEEICKLGLDGIEVFSSYHNKDDVEFYNSQAERLGLIKTVGSDYHGKCKPAVKMGSIDYIAKDVINGLKKFNLL